MITLSKTNFGGNDDNYYNFKQSYLAAQRALSISQHYICPEAKKTVGLKPVEKNLNELKEKMYEIEFED